MIRLTDPELRQSCSLGGFNTQAGANRKYIAGRKCWSVFYTDNTGYRAELCFVRKCDAKAVFAWMLNTEWSGTGDYEGSFLEWASLHAPDLRKSFKGTI